MPWKRYQQPAARGQCQTHNSLFILFFIYFYVLFLWFFIFYSTIIYSPATRIKGSYLNYLANFTRTAKFNKQHGSFGGLRAHSARTPYVWKCRAAEATKIRSGMPHHHAYPFSSKSVLTIISVSACQWQCYRLKVCVFLKPTVSDEGKAAQLGSSKSQKVTVSPSRRGTTPLILNID